MFAVVGAFLRIGRCEVFAIIERIPGVNPPAFRQLARNFHLDTLTLHFAVGDVAVIATDAAHGVIFPE
ncbi:hypothetical protein M5G07_11040 [Serratia symbiotica]|nr:hypothetical protein [Serratia symbiotica]